MISVLICSANDQFLAQVKENIDVTIGSMVEVLVYDNKKNRKGICEVYNILAAKAAYPVLCFVHEDVLFTTKDWGEKILDIFKKRSDIGVVGIAGTKYKAAAYSGWYTGMKEFDCGNYTHRYSYGDEKVYLNPTGGVFQEVVCVDGVFICCRKQVWEQVKFDEKNLSGFHFYDISFSLEAARICAVAVTYEVDLLHITKGGDYGNNWIETAIHFHQLEKSRLPYTKLATIDPATESKISITWLEYLKKYNISMANKLKWINKQQLHKKKECYYSILKFLLYTPLGLKHVHKLLKRLG